MEAFELGLVEMSCLGETVFDAAGYPYEDEVHALADDWARLGGDFRVAAQKIEHAARQKAIAGGSGDVEEKKVEARPTTEAATTKK